MTLIDTIILGALQGITEFLPISSSGHLVMAQHLLGVDTPERGHEDWANNVILLAHENCP